MKPAFLSVLCLLYSACCFCQTKSFPCTFQVVNSRTKDPILKADVTVEQAPLKRVPTDNQGLSVFKLVPEGRIDVRISHPEYRELKIQETISAETKNNFYVIELVPNSESSLLIVGKIQNKSNEEISNVIVEAKVDGRPYKTVSDESGNYQFDIPLKTFRNDRIQLEFKKGICRYSEEVQIPESRYLTKNVTIACDEKGAAPDMNGVWKLVISSEYALKKEGPMNTAAQIGGIMSLTQNGNTISGKFGSDNWVYCANAEVNGTVNGDKSVRLNFICTKGPCMNSALISITGNFINNSFVGKVEPAGSPTGNCVLYIGKVSMNKM